MKKYFPNYVMEMIPRLRCELPEREDIDNPIEPWSYQAGRVKGDMFGYGWRLYGKNRCGGEIGLMNEAKRLVKFAKRKYAEAYIVRPHFWNAKYNTRSVAYKHGHRNYVYLVITDPVALRIEREKKGERVDI